MLPASNFKRTILKIVVEKCAHFPQLINQVQPAEINMFVRNLFHKNHVTVSTELKMWTLGRNGIFILI